MHPERSAAHVVSATRRRFVPQPWPSRTLGAGRLRRRTLLRSACVIVLGALLTQSTLAQAGASPSDDDRTAAPTPALPPSASPPGDRRPYLIPLIPAPLSASEIDDLTRLLGLSHAQHAALDAIIADYETEAVREFEQAFNDLRSRSREVTALRYREDPEDAAQMAAWTRDCERAARRNERLIDQFFVTLTPLLSDGQQILLHRVRAIRQRHVSRRLGFPFPAADADLFMLAHQECTRQEAEDTLRRPACVVVFDRYDALSVPLAQQRLAGAYDRAAERPRIYAKYVQRHRANTASIAALRAARQVELDASQRPYLHALRATWELNQRTLDELDGVLPATLATEIRRQFRETAFPDIWPCPYDLTAIFAALGTEPKRSDLTEHAITEIENEWQSAMATTRREMERVSAAWQLQYIRETGPSRDDYETVARTMVRLDDERKAISDHALAQLLALTGEQPPSALTLAIEAYRTTRDAQLAARHGSPDQPVKWPSYALPGMTHNF